MDNVEELMGIHSSDGNFSTLNSIVASIIPFNDLCTLSELQSVQTPNRNTRTVQQSDRGWLISEEVKK